MANEVYLESKGTNISTPTTTQVATGRALLVGVLIGSTASGTITVYDDVSGTSNTKIIFKSSVAENYYPLNLLCANGIKVVTTASPSILVTWKQP